VGVVLTVLVWACVWQEMYGHSTFAPNLKDDNMASLIQQLLQQKRDKVGRRDQGSVLEGGWGNWM
jgi:hypothetical protein